MNDLGLPALDTHAHIAPDVTPGQIAALGNAVVFAMTRSLHEANQVKNRPDSSLVWGLGVHPGVAKAREMWDSTQFKDLLHSFALVGEIGLDRRGGAMAEQRSIFKEILTIVRSEPVLVSVHSTGASTEVVRILHETGVQGAILHWFNGDRTDVQGAIEAGAYFSVNAAMSREQIQQFPRERVLCETDFPARKVRSRKPADLDAVEQLLGQTWDVGPQEVRAATWWNLRTLSEQSGAIERLPESVVDTLLFL
ncbi:TatD family hydrolase [Arthrobacter sp. HY1533]|uniref:TatD family hydrolase n=1 Tax=Arthrobacter sp. HY1533 TaxID=2970919 RepID=UPI0022B9F998|nr:TatD family hydrolase [Arthrobacter sp. HY1533]